MTDTPKGLAAHRTTLTDAQLDNLSQRAQRGDVGAMEQLEAALDSDPSLQARFMDIATMARTARAQATFGATNLLSPDLLERRVAAMRRELESQHPSPLERLLAEQVATCWAAMHLADLDALNAAEGRLERAEYFDQRHYRAHKRYLDSVVALARVRRLLSPATVAQVNIAQPGAQQLNVATAQPAPDLIDVAASVEGTLSGDTHTPSA